MQNLLFSYYKSTVILLYRYHYYGIGIKETSIYYHSVYAGKGLTRYVHCNMLICQANYGIMKHVFLNFELLPILTDYAN